MIESTYGKKQSTSSNDHPSQSSHVILSIPSPSFHESDDELEEESLIDHKYSDSQHSGRHFPLLQYLCLQKQARWILICLILLGKFTLWVLDKLLDMFKFRQNWMYGILCGLKFIDLTIIEVPYTLLMTWPVLTLFSQAYAIYLKQAQKSQNTSGNEALDIFNQKTEDFNSLLSKEERKRSCGGTISQRLANRIREARMELMALEQDLFIIPALQAKYCLADTDRLHEEQINALPSEEYSIPDFPIEESDMCSVCIQEFQESEELLRLPCCRCRFHKTCLVGWLKEIPECPNCKTIIQITSS